MNEPPPPARPEVPPQRRGRSPVICECSLVGFPGRLVKTHNDCERLHPYPGGNGRTGRLLLKLLLVRLGYPPAIVSKNERMTYLKTMRKADYVDKGLLGELIARAADYEQSKRQRRAKQPATKPTAAVPSRGAGNWL